MEKKVVMIKFVQMRCPECLNYMKVKADKSGTYSGKCSVCQSSIYSKQHSARERHIKIVRNTVK